MFATIKGLELKLNQQIEYFNINLQVLNGELDNPNGYSRDYILGVMTSQVKGIHSLVDRIKEQSNNAKLIAKCEQKVADVSDRFNSIP